MDELLLQGQWGWLLVVPVATGLFALGGSWLGSHLGRMTEHKQWHRNEKKVAYSNFLELLDELTKAYATDPFSVERAQVVAVTSSRSSIKLFGSVNVRRIALVCDDEADQLFRTFAKLKHDDLNVSDAEVMPKEITDRALSFTQANSQLIRAMRDDLKVTDPEDEMIIAENAARFAARDEVPLVAPAD